MGQALIALMREPSRQHECPGTRSKSSYSGGGLSRGLDHSTMPLALLSLKSILLSFRGNGCVPYGHPKGIAMRRESSRRYESPSARSNPNDDEEDADLGATDSGDPQGRHNLRYQLSFQRLLCLKTCLVGLLLYMKFGQSRPLASLPSNWHSISMMVAALCPDTGEPRKLQKHVTEALHT